MDADQPPTEFVASGAAPKRTRGRPSTGVKAARKSRAKVPRLMPCYVDMGGLSLTRPVRYDAGQQRYDLRDLFDLAYGSKKGYATSRRMTRLRVQGLFKGCEPGDDYGVVKWLDDPDANLNRVHARETATAAAAALQLRTTQGAHASERASAS